MRTIRYVGPAPEVMIAATGQVVGSGQTVDIDDDVLAASLCEQTDNWHAEGATPLQPDAELEPVTNLGTQLLDGEDPSDL